MSVVIDMENVVPELAVNEENTPSLMREILPLNPNTYNMNESIYRDYMNPVERRSAEDDYERGGQLVSVITARREEAGEAVILDEEDENPKNETGAGIMVLTWILWFSVWLSIVAYTTRREVILFLYNAVLFLIHNIYLVLPVASLFIKRVRDALKKLAQLFCNYCLFPYYLNRH